MEVLLAVVIVAGELKNLKKKFVESLTPPESSCVLEPHAHDLPSNRSLSLLVRLYLLRPRRRMVALVCFRATCSRYLFIPQSVPNSSDCTFCAPGEGWWPSLFSKQGLTKARASGRQSPYHHRAVTRARVLITCCNRVMMVRVESVSL